MDSAQLTLEIDEKNGANLLEANLPNTNISAIFTSNVGVVGTAIFDPADAKFKASFTSTQAGVASVTAQFLVDNKVCMVPGVFNGANISDKVINIEFAEAAGKYPRRRQERDYVQSAGGRRRP